MKNDMLKGLMLTLVLTAGVANVAAEDAAVEEDSAVEAEDKAHQGGYVGLGIGVTSKAARVDFNTGCKSAEKGSIDAEYRQYKIEENTTFKQLDKTATSIGGSLFLGYGRKFNCGYVGFEVGSHFAQNSKLNVLNARIDDMPLCRGSKNIYPDVNYSVEANRRGIMPFVGVRFGRVHNSLGVLAYVRAGATYLSSNIKTSLKRENKLGEMLGLRLLAMTRDGKISSQPVPMDITGLDSFDKKLEVRAVNDNDKLEINIPKDVAANQRKSFYLMAQFRQGDSELKVDRDLKWSNLLVYEEGGNSLTRDSFNVTNAVVNCDNLKEYIELERTGGEDGSAKLDIEKISCIYLSDEQFAQLVGYLGKKIAVEHKFNKWVPSLALGVEKTLGNNMTFRTEVFYNFGTSKTFEYDGNKETTKVKMGNDLGISAAVAYHF